jgi:hypothetical protein
MTTLGVADFDLSGATFGVIEHLARLTRRYNVQALKRFAPETRTAMLACFLVEAHKSLLDHLIAIHEQYITGLARRSCAGAGHRDYISIEMGERSHSCET